MKPWVGSWGMEDRPCLHCPAEAEEGREGCKGSGPLPHILDPRLAKNRVQLQSQTQLGEDKPSSELPSPPGWGAAAESATFLCYLGPRLAVSPASGGGLAQSPHALGPDSSGVGGVLLWVAGAAVRT